MKTKPEIRYVVQCKPVFQSPNPSWFDHICCLTQEDAEGQAKLLRNFNPTVRIIKRTTTEKAILDNL